MLNKTIKSIPFRPKHKTLFVLIILILTFSGSSISYSDVSHADKESINSSSFSSPVPYTKIAIESLYNDSHQYILNSNLAINEALDSKIIDESLSLIEKANKKKNISRFREGTSSKNSANRYSEWLNSDRTLISETPRYYAVSKFKDYDWDIESQWGCLDRLWWHESNWNYQAGNPEAAYGIPQSAPGNKMSSAGDDWKTNPKTQIVWGLDYIKSRYETPCSAFEFWKKEAEYGDKGYGWY